MPATAAVTASPHAALITRLQAADPEPALADAFAQLARGADVALLLATTKALVRAGLGGIATRVLRSVGSTTSREPAFATLLEEIDSGPTGEIPRTNIAEQFSRNARCVLNRWPGLKQLLDPSSPPAHVQVFRSRARNMHVMHRDGPGLRTVFPLIDFRAVAREMKMPAPDLNTSFLLIGLPSPQLLTRLLTVDVSGYGPPIDIIEPDADALRIWLSLIDESVAWEDGRIGLFVGAVAVEDYQQHVLNTPGRVPASLVLTNHRPNWQPPRVDAAVLQGLAESVQRRQRDLRKKNDERLERCDANFWRSRFESANRASPPLQIVGFTNRYSTVIQYAMRDLAAAFRRLGHEFTIASQPDASSAVVDVAGVLASRPFDLFVAINHLRFEYADAIPRNMPFVGWVQDHMDHLWTRKAGESVGDLDLVVTHSPHVLTALYGYRADRTLASSNLTDPHVYSAEPLPAEQLEPHRCDLSFASHGAATPQQLVDELGRGTTPALHRLFARFLQIAQPSLDNPGWLTAHQLVELMLRAERESGHPALSPAIRRAHVYPHIARLYDRMFRHQTLEWAAAWARWRGRRWRIYGRGWENHRTLGEFAAGEAASGGELRAVYQASTISLQANGYASLHQRLLDGLACGAMVISRYNPADFLREPFARIRNAIVERGLQSLNDVMSLRREDAAFNAVCEEAEQLTSVVIAPSEEPRRQAHVRITREGNSIPDLLSDDGLFAFLRDMQLMPARVAADLPGFAKTTFRSESEMHDLLDRLVNDALLRNAIVAPMRQSVLAHDTFDALAKRIIAAFATGVVQCAGC